MKRLKMLFGYSLAVILLAGISLSPMQTNNANAQTDPEIEDPEPCGICVTPNETYPYPDAASSLEDTGCEAC